MFRKCLYAVVPVVAIAAFILSAKSAPTPSISLDKIQWNNDDVAPGLTLVKHGGGHHGGGHRGHRGGAHGGHGGHRGNHRGHRGSHRGHRGGRGSNGFNNAFEDLLLLEALEGDLL